MSLEQNKAVVRAFVAAINAQDWKHLDDFVAEEVIRHSGTAGQLVVPNREELKAFLQREAVTFPDAEESIHFLIAEGDMVAARLSFRGMQQGPMGPFPPSGKILTADFMVIFRLDNGQIAEVWVEWDNLHALIQLGHYTPPPSTSA
jgi:steroid delta-isomerase-like uncharacterized protein